MSRKILLADDSLTIQKVVQITFARQDVELTTVDNGDDALRKAKEIRPNIILADVMMPGQDGYTLTKSVRSDPQLAAVPVLLLAGAYEPFDEGKAKTSGANGFILKPFESQALIQKVEEVISGAGAAAAAPAAAPKPAAAAPKPAPAPKPATPAAAPRPAPATISPKPAAVPKPAAPAPRPTPVAAHVDASPSMEIEVASDSMWDLSDEPSPPPKMPAAAPPPPPPPASMETSEFEVEVATDDAWDLSEDSGIELAATPAAAPARTQEIEIDTADSWDLSEEPLAAPTPPTAAPAPRAAATPTADLGSSWDLSEEPGIAGAPEDAVADAIEDAWDLSEGTESQAAEPAPVLEVEEPVLELTTDAGVAQDFSIDTEVEVAVDTGSEEGDVWDLAEDQPLDLSGAPEPEPLTPPPPPPAPKPAPMRPAPMPAASLAGSVASASDQSSGQALEQAVRSILERELPRVIGELTHALAAEVRQSVPKIAERLIQQEIDKLKSGS